MDYFKKYVSITFALLAIDERMVFDDILFKIFEVFLFRSSSNMLSFQKIYIDKYCTEAY